MEKNLENKKDINNTFEENVTVNEENKLAKQNRFVNFIRKFLTKEVILYVVFGALTTLINIGSFSIMTYFFDINDNLANNIAIVLAVLFAYVINKDLVFHSQANGFGEKFIEFCKFILGRLATMFIESIGCLLMFAYLPIPTIISKCIITIVVTILNFFISKFFAFKNDK